MCKYEIDKATIEEMERKIVTIYHSVFDKEKRADAKIATIELMEIFQKIKGKKINLKG